MQLSTEQLAALNSALTQNTLITGLAGTGKSVIAAALRDQFAGDPRLSVTASTGIAAVAIGGVTIHSWTGMGIADADAETLSTRILHDKRRKKQRQNIRGCRILIIDETSMLSGEFFDKMDYVFRRVRNSCEPFGGIRMVLFGDFLQLPPVSKKADEPARFAFESESWAWAEISICLLTRTYRQADQDFADALASIRTGTPSEAARQLLNERVKAIDNDPKNPPIVLTTHNVTADEINKESLAKIDESAHSYRASDFLENPESDILKNCIAAEILTLKRDARVMLLANIDQENGFVNGTTGWVYDMKETSVTFLRDDGELREITPHTWEIKENERVIASRFQIPLRLAYAISVHKSQGMTLSKVSAFLGAACEVWQGYVALSRVKSAAGLFIKSGSRAGIKAHPKALAFYNL